MRKQGLQSEWRGFDNRQKHDPPLLFDFSVDLGERNEIAAELPEVVDTIQQAIRDRHRSIEPQGSEGHPSRH